MISQLHSILAAYGVVAPNAVHPRGSNGGFSGAVLWRVETERGPFCLRRWPEDFHDWNRLSWAQRVLAKVADSGCNFLALPELAKNNEAFVEAHGFLWELSRWMPGEANFNAAPTRPKLINAMNALAMFHLATKDIESEWAVPFSVSRRIQQLESLPELMQQVQGTLSRAPTRRIGELAAIAATKMLPQRHDLLLQANEFAGRPVRVQPVIRDIWHDHVLFTGERVTGIVDFGAMRIDSAACDLARLIGSLRMGGCSPWTEGLAAYQQFRPLETGEIRLIPWLHRTGLVLASLNWLEWVFVHQRQFADWQAVTQRLEHMISEI